MFAALLSLAVAPATAETLTTSTTCSSPIDFVLDEPLYRVWWDPDGELRAKEWLDAILSGSDRGKLGIKVDTLCCPSGQSAYAVDSIDIYWGKQTSVDNGEIYSAFCD